MIPFVVRSSVILLLCSTVCAAEIRIGFIGLDTSHCATYARLLHDASNPEHVPGARVVAAFKGGSSDVEKSASRVDGFAADMKEKHGVKICDTIEEVVAQVDALMILSGDGRTHLAQARRVFPSRKPVFVDKPAAGTLRDAIELFRLAEEHQAPCFSSSSLRFGAQMDKVKATAIGTLQGVVAWGPAHTEPHHPDFYWYGIHTVEMLYAVIGTGCERVVRSHTADTDVITGTWQGGRVATVHGIRNARGAGWGLLAFGNTGMATRPKGQEYASQLREILKFFRTKNSPVAARETIEILAFMEAADESKRRGGAPVTIAEVMAANQPAASSR
jgi:predicted dehydrogenase